MSHPLAEIQWDAIVVGTGIGGGTIGRALAEAGHRVLFLEKGRGGHRSERNGLSEIFVPEARAARGLWPDPLHVTLNGQETAFYAPLGSGVGGSSAFYAATLERPERHDLDSSDSHPSGGWAVGFDAMLPWYEEAARVYRVYGTDDPLSPEPPLPLRNAPELGPVEKSLMDSFRAAGLHPYHAHTAIERLEGCENCLGVKCPKPCKMDGRSAGVEPAMATGNAEVLTEAEVIRIDADQTRVNGLMVRVDGKEHRFRAKRYILAGGALGSPRLLLASANENWPDGLANRSGLVGRNLMFHLNEMFALWPRDAIDGPATKAISLRDLYHAEGTHYGTIQAMGIRASYGEIVHYLNRMLAQSTLPGAKRLAPLSRIPAALAHRMLGSAQIFVGLMEDLPYPENRVTFDPDQPERLSVDYRYSSELLARRKAFRRAIKRAFKGHRRLFLGQQPDLNYGHPCGTLRFGTDPEKSVLNADCRAHDLTNLWVTDSSFMPTSMGVNPSLTIAANALRVASTFNEEPQ
ncbi:GMC oxidoreductase [Thalassococcus lentus]|uniref:GMC family oxidoreductase n=1 Tax=Thalassococcus lentus TaxID=1210524 RepID=A0ABT4XMS8_9RHOB|nr:GMC family oxidoreductase [Thalassococcus lentus]MDA7423251.1 GMC family oxidoreductase [Thalassococcus lentus]